MLKRILFWGIQIGVVLAVSFALFAATGEASHSWGPYHWARTANPFTLKVGDNVSSAWDTYLDEAISDWSASSVLNLVKVAGNTKPKNCRPTAGRIEVCNSKYGRNGWLGIAQIWITGGEHITQAITKVNDTYFNTATYNTPAWRRLVMCQEIAHDFGLDHQDENFNNTNLGSCMDYTDDPDGPPSNEHPNAHDFEQIEIIYTHLDNSTTISSTPAMRGNDNFDDPITWGKQVRTDASGRGSVYERNLGGGKKVLTHVFWVK